MLSRARAISILRLEWCVTQKQTTPVLLDQWKECALLWEKKQPRYLFPGDEDLGNLKERISPHKSFDAFAKSPKFGEAEKGRFHLELLPNPFWGDLEHASIFLLLLNPGFNPAAWFLEEKIEDVRRRRLQNLRQDFEGEDYPFFPLDPAFCYHPSANYWRKKFGSLLGILGRKKSYRQAAQLLARNVACLQLVPYHSESFRKLPRGLRNLPSIKASKDYVNEIVVPKAKAGNATLIVMRSEKSWISEKNLAGIEKHDDIIIYKGSATRGAYISASGIAEQAILKRLKDL